MDAEFSLGVASPQPVMDGADDQDSAAATAAESSTQNGGALAADAAGSAAAAAETPQQHRRPPAHAARRSISEPPVRMAPDQALLDEDVHALSPAATPSAIPGHVDQMMPTMLMSMTSPSGIDVPPAPSPSSSSSSSSSSSAAAVSTLHASASAPALAGAAQVPASLSAMRDTEAAGRPRLAAVVDCDITSSTHMVDWSGLSRWAVGICVVGFDLELGQALELMAPSVARLDADDVRNVCYHSFPDSNSGCRGDTQFSFRIRKASAPPPSPVPTAAKSPPTARAAASSSGCPFPRRSSKTHMFGSVYFRQVPDPSSKRGYYQKSVVVLSELPYTELFSHVVAIVARAYFDRGFPALEEACMDIASWPPPSPESELSLRIYDRTLKVQLPRPDGLELHAPPPPAGVIYGSLFAGNMYHVLKPVLAQVQLLWELMLTAEPIMVLAITPQVSSATVLALLSLIAPLEYFGDYRPFFTIHDPDFSFFTKKGPKQPHAIFGVTNPYFEKALEHWPTVLRMAQTTVLSSRTRHTSQSSNPGSRSSSPNIAPRGLRANAGGVFKSGLNTKAKRLLDEDRQFLKTLLSAAASEHESKVAKKLGLEIRRYFVTLTHNFMIPLERYVTSLMPLQKSVSPFKTAPSCPPFHARDFLQSLRDPQNSQILGTRRGNWTALYGRFLKSPNFRGWLASRQQAANAELLRTYLKAVGVSDMGRWVAGQPELKVMDHLIHLRDAMEAAQRKALLTRDEVEAVNVRMVAMAEALPDDVRASMSMGDKANLL